MTAWAIFAVGVLAAAPAGEFARAGRDVPVPERSHHVAPGYPPSLRSLVPRPMGIVALDLGLHEDGRVIDIKVVRGEPLISELAIAAVKQWRYAPTVVDGQPRKVAIFEIVEVFPDPSTRPPYFVRLLKDTKEPPAVRRLAIDRLAALGGNKTTLAALQRAAKDVDETVRKAAADALAHLDATSR